MMPIPATNGAKVRMMGMNLAMMMVIARVFHKKHGFSSNALS